MGRRGAQLLRSNILKVKEVAVFGDSTGYGTSRGEGRRSPDFKKDGAKSSIRRLIDPNQPDVTPDMLRMRDAGAKALVCWSVTTGLNSRLMNARAAIKWDVPIVGHPALGTGEVGKLVDKPANWDNVYMVGYRSCSYGADGKLPPRTQEFVDQVKGKIELVGHRRCGGCVCAVDAVNLIAQAVGETGSTEPRRDHRLLEHARPLSRPVRRLPLHRRSSTTAIPPTRW